MSQVIGHRANRPLSESIDCCHDAERFANGDIFEGTYAKDGENIQRNGMGKYTFKKLKEWKTSASYQGEYKADKKNGSEIQFLLRVFCLVSRTYQYRNIQISRWKFILWRMA